MITQDPQKVGILEKGSNVGSPRLVEIKKEKLSYQGTEKKKALITILPSHCKGDLCKICVEFCPTKVLEMGAFHVEVVDINACTKCMLCEVRCPDFAIFVD